MTTTTHNLNNNFLHGTLREKVKPGNVEIWLIQPRITKWSDLELSWGSLMSRFTHFAWLTLRRNAGTVCSPELNDVKMCHQMGVVNLSLSPHLLWLNVDWGPGQAIVKLDLEIFHSHKWSCTRTGSKISLFIKKKTPSLNESQKNFCHILCCLKIWDQSVRVSESCLERHNLSQNYSRISTIEFSWKNEMIFQIPTSSETRDVKEKNSNVNMSSTILLAISITIQKRRNFFQENWVWNHFARILMWRETTSLSLGWTFLANLWWTTGILREFSWGGGPSLCGVGLGFGAIVYCIVLVVSLSQCYMVLALSLTAGHRGDCNAVLVSCTLGPSRAGLRTGRGSWARQASRADGQCARTNIQCNDFVFLSLHTLQPSRFYNCWDNITGRE